MTAPEKCIRRPNSVYTKCPCETCTADRARLAKVIRIYGPLPRVTSEAAWTVLDWMLNRGYLDHAIANVTGIPHLTIQVALKRRQREGHWQAWGPKHAAAIVAAKDKHPSEGHVGGVGSTRRIQALAVIGWSVRDLSHELGVHNTTLSHIKSGKGLGRVWAANANTIREGYERLNSRPGGSPATTRIALAQGWAAPCAWDYLDIDDPDARPSGVPRDTNRADRRAIALDAIAEGRSVAEAAGIAGVSEETVRRALRGEKGREAA